MFQRREREGRKCCCEVAANSPSQPASLSLGRPRLRHPAPPCSWGAPRSPSSASAQRNPLCPAGCVQPPWLWERFRCAAPNATGKLSFPLPVPGCTGAAAPASSPCLPGTRGSRTTAAAPRFSSSLISLDFLLLFSLLAPASYNFLLPCPVTGGSS